MSCCGIIYSYMTLGARMHYPDLESAICGTQAPLEIIRELELVDVGFIDPSYERVVGQLVVARCLAGEIQEIFGKIRDQRFPLHSVIPIAYFGHDDGQSVAGDNTSGFNYRPVAGTDELSRHSYGRAVDINPWHNPHFKPDGTLVTPSIGDRIYNANVAGTIVADGPIVSIFVEHGWEWGGHWPEDPDYQHFDKIA